MKTTLASQESVSKFTIPAFVTLIALFLCGVLTVSAAGSIGPDPVLPSDITLMVSHVNTMPYASSPTMPQNLGSPVTINNKLYLID